MAKIGANEINDCFKAFDLDGDGCITRVDLAMGVRALGKNPTEAQYKEAVKGLSDNVDLATFKTIFGKPFPSPQDQDKKCRDAFKLLDADNNGTIAESELRQMLATVGDPMTHQEIDILMEDVDVDDLGRVFYHQLVDLMVTGCDELIR
jgi:Ca2+-binding EF-hand superfamily protein